MPQAPAAEALANGALHALANAQPAAELQKQPGAQAALFACRLLRYVPLAALCLQCGLG